MKHIFQVFSPLTFYISKRIIEVKQLDLNNCILLLTRDYKIPKKYDSLFENQIHTSYNVSEKEGRIFAGWKFWKTKKNIKEFENKIDKYLHNNQFIWYCSVCSNDICSLMVTHRNCVGYYITEDGMSSYRDFNPKTFTGTKALIYKYILNVFYHRLFAVKDYFIYTDNPKFRGCIATNEKCFPLHRQYIEVIGMPFEEAHLDTIPDAVISIEPNFEHIENNVILQLYNKLAEIIKKKQYKHIAYKFHPVFNAQVNIEIKKQYEIMLQQIFDKDLIEIDSDQSLESILITYKSDFYTGNSSVAIYASTAGTKCYSFIDFLCKKADYYKQFRCLMYDFCTIIEI